MADKKRTSKDKGYGVSDVGMCRPFLATNDMDWDDGSRARVEPYDPKAKPKERSIFKRQ